MAIETEPKSPRIAQLEHRLRAGDANAVDAFWTRLEDEGTPIVEPIHGDADHSLVTFVWRQTGAVREAAVYARGLALPGLFDKLRPIDGTDLHYLTHLLGNDFRTSYLLALDPPSFSLPPTPEEERRLMAYIANASFVMQDPRSHKQMQVGVRQDPGRPDDPPSPTFVSILELPQAPSQPYLARRTGIPHGWVYSHRFDSAILGNKRDIYVYTPPGYAESDMDYGLLITFDGPSYIRGMQANNTLDNLIAEARLKPLIAAFIAHPDPASRDHELACDEPFSDSLATEVVPWLRANYRVTSDPGRVVVCGLSLGGLAAGFVALRHPEVYGNVLSQSGAFESAAGLHFSKPLPEGHVPWLPQQYASAPTLPLRFYLEAGLREGNKIPEEERSRWPNILRANRGMRDVLVEKGYEVHYSEFNGGHDHACWRASLADGLIALLGTD